MPRNSAPHASERSDASGSLDNRWSVTTRGYPVLMGDEEGRLGMQEEQPNTSVIQLGRFELRGASAKRAVKLVGYTIAVLIASAPGVMAFFAYAEGGTSLWAAIAFTVAVPAGIGVWLVRDVRRASRRERRSHAR
jgi:hypothetical protein